MSAETPLLHGPSDASLAASDPYSRHSIDAVSADDVLPRYATRRALWDARHALAAGAVVTFCSSMPYASLPHLQDKTYGGNAFLIVGIACGVQGVYNFFVSPTIGGASDRYGRGKISAIAMAALALPFALDLALGHFVFLMAAVFLTLFNAVGSISTAQVSDVLPQTCRTVDHPFVFGALMVSQALIATFGSMLGAFLPWDYLRLIAIGVILSAAVALYFIYPKDSQPSQELLDCEARANDILAAREERDRMADDGKAAVSLSGSSNDSINESQRLQIGTLDRDDGRALNDDEDQDNASSVFVGAEVEKCSQLKRSLRILRRNVQLRLLVFISILNGMAEQSLTVLMPLYCEKNLGYTKADLMLILVSMIFAKIFASFVFAPVISRRFTPLIALRCAVGVNIVFVSALVGLQKDQPWMGWAVVAILGSGAMAVYPLVALFAADAVRTEGADTGLAQGTICGARAMAEGLSPAFIGGLFHYTKHTAVPGSPLFVGTASVICALALTWRLRPVPHMKPE